MTRLIARFPRLPNPGWTNTTYISPVLMFLETTNNQTQLYGARYLLNSPAENLAVWPALNQARNPSYLVLEGSLCPQPSLCSRLSARGAEPIRSGKLPKVPRLWF